jgi:hypothetical protein
MSVDKIPEKLPATSELRTLFLSCRECGSGSVRFLTTRAVGIEWLASLAAEVVADMAERAMGIEWLASLAAFAVADMAGNCLVQSQSIVLEKNEGDAIHDSQPRIHVRPTSVITHPSSFQLIVHHTSHPRFFKQVRWCAPPQCG